MANNNSTVKEASLHAVDYLQVIRNRWKEIFLTFLLVFMAAAVVTYLLPPTYRATAQCEIRDPRPDINPMNSGGSFLERQNNANYLNTQFEVIRAPETLKYVVDKMKLVQDWGVGSVDNAVARLQGMLEVVPVRNTNLVNVIVRGDDPSQVQGLADGIVEAYQKRRENEENERAYNAIRKLQSTLQMAKDDVVRKNSDLRHLIQLHGYYGPNLWGSADGSLQASPGESQDFEASRMKILDLERQIRSQEALIESIEKQDDQQLITYMRSTDLNLDLPGVTSLRTLYSEYETNIREKSALATSGYGPNHPRLKYYDEKNVALLEDMKKALESVRESLPGKLSLLKVELEREKQARNDLEKKLSERTLIDNELVEARREYAVAQERVKEMERSYIVEVASLRIPRVSVVFQAHATRPTAPVSPKVSLNLGVGAAAGLVLGLIVAFMIDYFDSSVKTVEEVENALGVPVIGVVPKDIGIFYNEPAENPDIEAYRILRTNIELAKKGINEVAMAFVSGTAGEGKTTTLCNLAFAYAQAGYTTLMIDADMRRSRLHQYYDLDNSFGLSNYLTSDASIEDVVMETAMENLYILPSGPSPRDPSGLLGSRKMAELVREAKDRFDVVLIDSPPILGVSDSAIIVRLVDMTIMVVQPRKLADKVLKKEKDVIETSGGNLIGTVLNNVDIGSDHQYQYYTTYYMYTPGQGSSKGTKVSKKKSSSKGKDSGDNAVAANTQQGGGSGSRMNDSEDLY